MSGYGVDTFKAPVITTDCFGRPRSVLSNSQCLLQTRRCVGEASVACMSWCQVSACRFAAAANPFPAGGIVSTAAKLTYTDSLSKDNVMRMQLPPLGALISVKH